MAFFVCGSNREKNRTETYHVLIFRDSTLIALETCINMRVDCIPVISSIAGKDAACLRPSFATTGAPGAGVDHRMAFLLAFVLFEKKAVYCLNTILILSYEIYFVPLYLPSLRKRCG
jgi:hypothetical protein